MISDCPDTLRRQRIATLRLAKAFRSFDAAEALFESARAELDEAFSKWSAGESTNRREARAMLELGGLVERKPLCAISIDEGDAR